jgi:hypothetical protein
MLSSPVSITFCFGNSLELTPIDAPAHGSRLLAIAVGALHVHLPAQASRHPKRFDFVRTKMEQRSALSSPDRDGGTFDRRPHDPPRGK